MLARSQEALNVDRTKTYKLTDRLCTDKRVQSFVGPVRADSSPVRLLPMCRCSLLDQIGLPQMQLMVVLWSVKVVYAISISMSSMRWARIRLRARDVILYRPNVDRMHLNCALRIVYYVQSVEINEHWNKLKQIGLRSITHYSYRRQHNPFAYCACKLNVWKVFFEDSRTACRFAAFALP